MNQLTEGAMAALNAATKLGIIATVGPDGLPHITLMSTLEAKDPTHLMFGQFSEGKSKEHLRQNPLMAFVVVTLDKRLVGGHARYTHATREGEDYEHFNAQPLFRYNTYFGINTVHYLDLLDATEVQPLPMARIIPSAIATRLGKGAFADRTRPRILKHPAQAIFNGLGNLKFLAYVDDDGMPRIFPLIQCQAADSRRLAFATGAFGKHIDRLVPGRPVAVFGMTMQMESVLARGPFVGFHRRGFIRLGLIDIDWVYNSMPPCHGQIYPEVPLKAFENQY
ncbi:MAG TPA: pyridoxamine 5'-phosphate oxidase family protein [Myxococcota bacterium]|nr:pyridoxamine 5'-phosphate oxidase family protein [Myxococcota bacterium]HNZ02862.1 pyridoxamine 5'-phosphate oxidase family protein [Myxococcota bacterium]HOD00126.1 pyridoxamine 5'-phosphate oxidase family protein [Myxococcota bacterium]HPB50713.1 pyridoxamine 5'-phosphate oxidase family protein [Myxococcota bacterium]HQP95809.1 pyridoxamine 5'-phosphate oxidase family protein [Myxococcota bacterium]